MDAVLGEMLEYVIKVWLRNSGFQNNFTNEKYLI